MPRPVAHAHSDSTAPESPGRRRRRAARRRDRAAGTRSRRDRRSCTGSGCSVRPAPYSWRSVRSAPARNLSCRIRCRESADLGLAARMPQCGTDRDDDRHRAGRARLASARADSPSARRDAGGQPRRLTPLSARPHPVAVDRAARRRTADVQQGRVLLPRAERDRRARTRSVRHRSGRRARRRPRADPDGAEHLARHPGALRPVLPVDRRGDQRRSPATTSSPESSCTGSSRWSASR